MTQLNDYAAWLGELAAAWDKLAAAAEQLRAAHIATLADHSDVYSQYMILKAQLAELAAHPAGQGVAMAALQRQLTNLQERSDDLREDYAGQSYFTPARVPDPGYAKRSGKSAGPGSRGRSGGGSPAAGAPEAGQSPVSPQSANPMAGQSLGAGRDRAAPLRMRRRARHRARPGCVRVRRCSRRYGTPVAVGRCSAAFRCCRYAPAAAGSVRFVEAAQRSATGRR